MFCNQCGAPCDDGAKFCKSCGNPLQAAAPQAPQQPVYQQPVYQQPAPQQPVYQQPVYQQPAPQQPAPQQPVYQQPVYQQPVYQQPVYQQPAQPVDFVAALKKNWTMVIAAIAAIAVIFGFLTTFCILEVPVSASGQSAYNSISDVADTMKMFDKSSITLYIGNILCGLISLVVGAAGILYFLKQKNNMPYYDQFVGKFIKTDKPGFLLGLAGAAGVVVQFILFLLSGFKIWGVKFSVSIPWMSWVVLVLFAALAVVDKFVVNKEK